MSNIENIKFTFSVPISISETKDIPSDDLIKRLKKISNCIFDLNITCRVGPFTTDAHGVQTNLKLIDKHLHDMLYIQSKTGIKISAVFNNILVPPNIETLQVFIKNFRPLYEKGIRSIVQPHSIWMYYNVLRHEFPELYIKDTVLRRTRDAMDFWNSAKLGFDYINLDRLLLRNSKELKRIKKAQKKYYEKYGKYVQISILFGESCEGCCPFWEEHYQHTMSHPDINNPNPEINNFIFAKVAQCKAKPIFLLNRVFNSPMRSDIEEIARYIDIIKFPGRSIKKTISDFVESIERYYSAIKNNDNEYIECFDYSCGFLKNLAVSKNIIHEKAFAKWRKIIKNCRFQCWDCNYCYEISKLGIKDGLIPTERLNF